MRVSERELYKCETVLIKVPKRTAVSNKTEFIFPDDQELRDKKLMWIQFYPSEVVPKTIDNQPVVPQGFLQNCYLTLETYSGIRFVNQKPVVDFLNVGIEGAMFIQKFNINFIGQRVNWPKCEIKLSDIGWLPDVDSYILANIGYKDITEEATKQMGVSFKNKK